MNPVLLINPGGQPGIFQGLAITATAKEPPIWCRLIASYLRVRQVPVAILDAEALELSSAAVANITLNMGPALVVVVAHGHQPSASTQKMPVVTEIVRAIKAASLSMVVVLVGGHVAALPRESLEETGADYACVGEGPVTVFEVAWALKHGKAIHGARGLTWLERRAALVSRGNGVLGHTAAAPNVEDLQGDMPGGCWGLLPMTEYRSYAHHAWTNNFQRQPYASVYSSLGCPFTCLAGDTLVNTIYGKISIKSLVDHGVKEIPVFTFDRRAQRGLVATARNIRCYGKNKRLVRVNFHDGTHIDCTPDHQFLEFKWGNGKSYPKQQAVEAQALSSGAHVRALRYSSLLGYPAVSWSSLGAMIGKPKGLKWWTRLDGSTYYAIKAQSPDDLKGRVGFNPCINHRVMAVVPLAGLHDVYCLEVPATGWFYANDVLVKNCGFCMIQTPFRQGDVLALKGKANSYRTWSVESTVTELETLVEEYGVINIRFDDEMFVLNEAHVSAVCEAITARWGDRLNLWCYGRVDQTKERFLEKMRRAGFRWLCLGIESLSAQVRDGVDKGGYGEKDIFDTVARVRAHGINIIANYMFGLPDDTLASMRQTLDMAKELNTEYVNMYAAVAYPGSRLWDERVKAGWQPPKSWLAWSFHSYEHEPLGTNTLTPAEVLRFRDAAFQEYMGNESYLAMVRAKFGQRAVDEVKATAAIPLRRKILGV